MDRERDLLKLCKPLLIKLTRLSNSDINEWKQKMKNPERSHSRRRSGPTMWQRGNFKRIKPMKTQKVKKRRIRRGKPRYIKRVILSDSDSESELSNLNVHDYNNAKKTDELHRTDELDKADELDKTDELEKVDEAVAVVHETSNQVNNTAPTLPKNDLPINDNIGWQYVRKRRRTSQSSNEIMEENDDIEILNVSKPNNLNNSRDNEETQVDFSKEIKIVSSRLEDSDDPQVERWRSKRKPSSTPKSKTRIPPKSSTLDCTVCSLVFENKEELSNHIFKHTQRELQDAYKAAKTKLRDHDNHVNDRNNIETLEKYANTPIAIQPAPSTTSIAYNKISDVALPSSRSVNTLTQSTSMVICSCHTENYSHNDESVQIEMVLFCEICHVLFRRSECFETHYRFSSICNADRTKGRAPKLFCSTCRVILNTLSNMRRHLQEHASVNFHGTVTFVCNICRVVFFGVGTVFCTHWFNHEKDPTFVASRYSFPKLCVSTQGTMPLGCAPDEQYFFVAEYVCRSCKLQFSSERELTDHTRKNCNGTPINSQVQNKTVSNTKSISNSKVNKSVEVSRLNIESISAKPLDVVDKWICEFCNGSYSSRAEFDEHSAKHLQDDEYPGYSCAYQRNGTPTFICNICRSIHNTLQELMKHWVIHDVIKFICSVCNEKCSTYNSFKNHISLKCWKLKPECRVWFDRQPHACRICKLKYKTSKELAHHYALDHAAGVEKNTNNPSSSQSKSVAEITPTNSKSNENNSANKIIPTVSHNINNNTATELNHTENLNVTTDGQMTETNIDNSINKESSTKNISSIEIIIPNVDKPFVNSCQNDDNSKDVINSNNKSIDRETSEINQPSNVVLLTSNLSNVTDADTLKTPLTEKTVDNISSNSDEAIQVIITRSNLHGSTTIINTDTTNLNNIMDDDRLNQINMRDIQMLQSTIPTPANFKSTITENSSNNNILVVGDVSVSSNKSDAVKIVKNSEVIEKIDDITDKVLNIDTNNEVDIIEIIKNSTTATSNNFVQNEKLNEVEVLPLKICELKNHESTALNVHRSSKEISTNSENIRPTDVKSTEKTKDNLVNSDIQKPRGFLRVKKFTELQAVRNYICVQCAAAFDNVKSLDEHIIAHDREITGNMKPPTMMAALILPQTDSEKGEIETVVPTSLGNIPQMAGKRTLPCIPQRVSNADARRACPLVRGSTNSRSINSSTMRNVSNVFNPQNIQPPSLPYYSCPICLVFRCENPEDFTNHLSTNHSNINIPINNTNSNNSNIVHSMLNETSKEKEKLFTCKVCSFSTLNRDMIVQHVRYFHLKDFSSTTNVIPQNNLNSVQHIDLTMPGNNSMNSNNLPPYKCNLCTNYQYNSHEELTQHFQTVHKSVIQKDIFHPYVCSICYHLFPTYNELMSHVNSHQNTVWT